MVQLLYVLLRSGILSQKEKYDLLSAFYTFRKFFALLNGFEIVEYYMHFTFTFNIVLK